MSHGFTIAAAQAHAEKHGYKLEIINNTMIAGTVAPSNREKDVSARTGAEGATGLRSAVDEFVAKTPRVRGAKLPNKTEQEFGRILQARIDKGELRGPLRFEAAKLRIGGNCYYCPDWMVDGSNRKFDQSDLGMQPIFFEVKGAHIWDDSKVKFKAAVEMHTWARFEMWQKKGGEWLRIH